MAERQQMSLLEIVLKDGKWQESVYIQLDWGAWGNYSFSASNFTPGKKEGHVIAGKWYCMTPRLFRLVATVQAGIFTVVWASSKPQGQFLKDPDTFFAAECYNGFSLATSRAFSIEFPPSPMDWSPKSGECGIITPMNDSLQVIKKGFMTWKKLRPI